METAVRELFPGLHDIIYLNTATMAVGCAPARDAYEGAVERWSEGRFDWMEAERAGEDARAAFSEIIGASPAEVAIVPAVSTAAGIVAANLPSAGRGENIVVGRREFSSNYFPWLLLRERGYDVRAVATEGASPPEETLARAADGGTRLIAVSAVDSLTGYRADLAALGRTAAACGAWLFVDACQAAGAVHLDVAHDNVDFLAAASHKFLLGSRGMGYLYVRREHVGKMRPVLAGWKAARDPGNAFSGPAMDLSPTASRLDTSLTWFSALAERASLGVLRRFGVAAVLDRDARLSAHLHDALAARRPGLRLMPMDHRSTIVSVPVRDADAVMSRFREANVVASVRGGRVRLAVHFYNDEAEIDRAVDLLGGE